VKVILPITTEFSRPPAASPSIPQPVPSHARLLTRPQTADVRILAAADTPGFFRFVGYQYSLPFMGGVFEKPEADIQSDLVPLAPLLDSNTVFVSHSPALGILDPGFGGVRIGSSSIRRLLEVNPVPVHIHGQSHGGYGREWNRFTVASAGQLRTMLLDLESMDHQVLLGE